MVASSSRALHRACEDSRSLDLDALHPVGLLEVRHDGEQRTRDSAGRNGHLDEAEVEVEAVASRRLGLRGLGDLDEEVTLRGRGSEAAGILAGLERDRARV